MGRGLFLLVPVLLRYSAVHQHLGLARTPGDMANFSARPVAFLQASGLLRFWPTTPTATTEEFLFPGLTPVLLVTAACVARNLATRQIRPALAACLLYLCGAADVGARIRACAGTCVFRSRRFGPTPC